MNRVKVSRILQRVHSQEGMCHLEFIDESGTGRFGRIVPPDSSVEYLSSIFARYATTGTLAVPDAISVLPDETICISIPSGKFVPPARGIKLEELIQPLRELHSKGMNHLSVDKYSFCMQRETVSLIFWGDGLLNVHPDSPPEVRSGGIPCFASDLYMLASTALKCNWLTAKSDLEAAVAMSSSNFLKRLRAAGSFDYKPDLGFSSAPILPRTGIQLVSGGKEWNRDVYVNHLTCLASTRGWACRVVRCSPWESSRPLPDMPAGTETRNPEELLSNLFSKQSNSERLLIINDFTEKQDDFTAILYDLAKIIPKGLRLVLCGEAPFSTFTGEEVKLQGSPSGSSDFPIEYLPLNAVIESAGPSWHGPRCRLYASCDRTKVKSLVSDEILSKEGAWRYTAALPSLKKNDFKAESLFRLKRYNETLKFVKENNYKLRASSLLALGRFEETANLLSDGREEILLAESLMGMGDIQGAINVISKSTKPGALPLLARLHDLSGTPASALTPLKLGLQKARGAEKIDICCALRSLCMRLGSHRAAIQFAETAVQTAREIASVSHMVRSLQERGRTLQITGNWRKSLKDYKSAVKLHDDSALTFTRPPHIDLFVLELKMGNITASAETFESLKIHLNTDEVLQKQMLNMLSACRGVLIGSGELSLALAEKAMNLAEQYGLVLYLGLSTLYAGQLNIQAGNIPGGLNLIREARSKGHLLGDKHLTCLAEIELLLEDGCQDLTSHNIETLASDLPEEYATLQIISNVNANEGFEKLLSLPSPLLACRLAAKCGMPENLNLKHRIIQHRKDIRKQLQKEERERYDSQFKGQNSEASPIVLSSRESDQLLGIISQWIIEFLEERSSLANLAKSMNLEEISTSYKTGMVKVPGSNPLFCSGRNGIAVAPYLEPVSAVIWAAPIPGVSPEEDDDLSRSIVGNSNSMKQVRLDIQMVAPTDLPVLISGETGTGKELCARAIHINSNRSQSNFVPVDCGAIPETLMESEFFGAAHGAYTGLESSRKGLLEEADKGTLFLDEIGNLPLNMQAKLLRVLDSGRFRRLGESTERKIDIRLIAATNANVEDEISAGSFRSDLYYRLSVVRIIIPPLRERLEDIPQLIAHFSPKRVSGSAFRLLNSHKWPGNIRELSNVLKRASISSSGGIIQRNHITLNKFSSRGEGAVTIHEVLRKHIKETVSSFGGNGAKAARALGCDPKTVRKYLADSVTLKE